MKGNTNKSSSCRWIFAPTSTGVIIGNCTVQMYASTHPGFIAQRWHVFVAHLVITWCSISLILFANRALPAINNLGVFLLITGLVVTIIVCAVIPSRSEGSHASNDFVWKDWSADIGYSSDGFVFLAGMLNGAFAVGTPDCCSHLAEEIPRPEVNVPKSMAAQMLIGFVTAFAYLVAIFYATSNLDTVLSGNTSFPLAEIYHQATGTTAGTVGLLLVILLPLLCTIVGAYLTASRVLWTLARDDATPFSSTLGKINQRWRNPFNAIFACGCIGTILGCIYIGSSAAFNAFVGSFVVLTTLSYVIAIGPHLLTRRKYVVPGPFWMRGAFGLVMHAVACSYIIVFIVIFFFPYSLPVSAQTMNYSVLMTGALTLFVTCWWFWKKSRGYRGPRAMTLRSEESVELSDLGGSEKV